MAVAALTGCGGTAKVQRLTGPGFTFSAPSGWQVLRSSTSVTAQSGSTDLVAVHTYRLTKTYTPDLYGASGRELGGTVAKLAKQLKGTVAHAHTVTVAATDAHSYRIDYGETSEELTFVFRDRTEFELVCRFAKGTPSAACTSLITSFTLV